MTKYAVQIWNIAKREWATIQVYEKLSTARGAASRARSYGGAQARVIPVLENDTPAPKCSSCGQRRYSNGACEECLTHYTAPEPAYPVGP